jgi:hypothetical protein
VKSISYGHNGCAAISESMMMSVYVSCRQGWVDEADDPAGNIAIPADMKRAYFQSLRIQDTHILLFQSPRDF